ncbi:MAG: NADH-quinone oxidoreductase subunit C [bacterium]|nr:NADH-quinone oxidoreductase subunit C [bacterium]
MNEETKQHIQKIEKEFPNSFLRIVEFRDEITVEVRKDDIFGIMKYLKESKETAFDFLVDETCVDYLKHQGDERFAVVYHLYSFTYLTRLRVKAWVPENDTKIPTLIPLWKTADWQEREIAEMFGITFDGHPYLKKLLLPDDFTGYPLRKDYPVQGEGYRDNFPNLKD